MQAAAVTGQAAQIEQVRTWMAEWYPGRSPEVGNQSMMRDLTGLSGDQLDRAFLRDMLPHHMTAVMMSQQLIVRGGTAHQEVGRMATSIRNEQHAEIFQMSQWLRDWFGADWHPRGGMGMGMGGDVGRR